jgi:hypothetical protein
MQFKEMSHDRDTAQNCVCIVTSKISLQFGHISFELNNTCAKEKNLHFQQEFIKDKLFQLYWALTMVHNSLT